MLINQIQKQKIENYLLHKTRLLCLYTSNALLSTLWLHMCTCLWGKNTNSPLSLLLCVFIVCSPLLETRLSSFGLCQSMELRCMLWNVHTHMRILSSIASLSSLLLLLFRMALYYVSSTCVMFRLPLPLHSHSASNFPKFHTNLSKYGRKKESEYNPYGILYVHSWSSMCVCVATANEKGLDWRMCKTDTRQMKDWLSVAN